MVEATSNPLTSKMYITVSNEVDFTSIVSGLFVTANPKKKGMCWALLDEDRTRIQRRGEVQVLNSGNFNIDSRRSCNSIAGS
jgi:hypothetical protein